MILIEVFRNGIGIHLNMRKLGRVPLEVDLQVSFGGESAPADVALKGTLTCVGPYVDLEGGVAAKDLAAVATSMFEEGLAPAATGFRVVGRQPRTFTTPKGELIGQIVR